MNRARSLAEHGHTYWSLRTAPGAAAGDRAHLLPIYDEYLVAYRDRVAVPHGPVRLASPAGGSVLFSHVLVIDGQIAGTWQLLRRNGAASVEVAPLRRLSSGDREAVQAAGARYARFLDASVALSISRVGKAS